MVSGTRRVSVCRADAGTSARFSRGTATAWASEANPFGAAIAFIVAPAMTPVLDMAHVQRAFEMLKPGGKMVAGLVARREMGDRGRIGEAEAALARRGVLLRRLDALETMAGCTRLFIDKTGTLTEDRLRFGHCERLSSASSMSQTELLARAASLAAMAVP